MSVGKVYNFEGAQREKRGAFEGVQRKKAKKKKMRRNLQEKTKNVKISTFISLTITRNGRIIHIL